MAAHANANDGAVAAHANDGATIKKNDGATISMSPGQGELGDECSCSGRRAS